MLVDHRLKTYCTPDEGLPGVCRMKMNGISAKHLITRLLDEHPKVQVLDWWKGSQTQHKVKSAVEQVLNENLPDSYDRVLFKEKSDNVFNLIVDFTTQGKKWAA
ncbi:MAG: hypothetical protein HOG60_06810 [Gammaproteobacteria bacterium]|jgi:type I restriction enzyme R subunit|nr:hypothetical protein [Gammaproteobacteria bacterium]